jgi:AcrR family transcriptional regulator
MPTPDRTSLDAIVRAARDLLEADGLAGVTMQAVASRVGVRAPSLYKRVRDRHELIRLVAEDALREFVAGVKPGATAVDLLNALRTFGKAHPAAFQLVMTPGPGTPTAGDDANRTASEPVLRAATELAGEAEGLEAARMLTAWAVGFISMELNGSFRLGGDVDRAWEFGVARIVASIKPPAAGTS